MSQSEDTAIEAGKFFGSFLVTLVSETFDKVLGRENKNNDDIVASIKDWGPLIDQIATFKRIHAFAQGFLDQFSTLLFGSEEDRLESVDEIHKAWETHYEGKYSEEILDFKDELESFKKQAKQKDGDEDLFIKDKWKLDDYTKKCFRQLKTFAPGAIQVAGEYIGEIDKTANIVNKRKILAVELPNWGDGETRTKIEGKAGLVLSRADSVLVNLIQILSFLYSRTITIKNEND